MTFDIKTAFAELFMMQQLKTGTVWVDTLIFGFFIFMTYHAVICMNLKYCFKKIYEIKSQPLSKLWLYVTNKTPRKMIVYIGFKYSSGYNQIKTYVDYPPPMMHIFNYMHNNSYKVENTYNIKYCEMVDVATDTQVKTFVPNEEGVSFELYPDIYIELSSEKMPNNKEHECLLDFTTVSCSVKTYEHDITYIHAFVKMCEEKFEKAVNDELSKHKFIFKHSGEKNINKNDEWSDTKTRGIRCAEYPLVTNKHLKTNCFFTMRDSLMKRIDFFVDNEEWYNKRGIPYQLTLVFEGSPGCGKTSTVKGIGTYTDRHIVDVDLTNIKSLSELEDVFNGNYINGKYIPTNKRIFLIDEIDKFFEGLSLKEEKEKNMAVAAETASSNMNPNNIVIVSKDGLSGDDGNKFKKTASCSASSVSNGLTRGQILSIMDGILESRGRFIICTANDTSKIDDTFKRPGRMDEIVHFSKCDALMINQLVDLFYNGCVEDAYTEEQIQRYKHIENIFSPSDINKVCFNNINSRERGEEYFMKKKEI
jgi:hypothetical protein